MVRKLGGNPIELWVVAEVIDKNGKILEKRRWKSKSWTVNMITVIWAHFANVESSVIDINAQSRTMSRSTIERANAGAGDDSFGIVVGSGTPSPWSLGSKIPHGTAANHLQYEAVTISGISNNQFDIARNFVNLSGGDIIVTECGLYVNHADLYPTAFILDEISPPITVPDQATLRIVYTIKTV